MSKDKTAGDRARLAASLGDEATLRDALASGADPNELGADGSTALMLAAERGKLACVKILAAVSDLEIQNGNPGGGGWTALQTAFSAGEADCARALLEAGAKPRRDSNRQSLWELALFADTVGQSEKALECARLAAPFSDFEEKKRRLLLAHTVRVCSAEPPGKARHEAPPLVRLAWEHSSEATRELVLLSFLEEAAPKSWSRIDWLLGLAGGERAARELVMAGPNGQAQPLPADRLPCACAAIQRWEEAKAIEAAAASGLRARTEAPAAVAAPSPSRSVAGPGRRL
jgi:ankyrin repeat protein